MAAINDIEIYKGEAVVLPFVQVVEGTTTPVNITDWAIQFSVKRRGTDTVALVSVAATITDGAAGAYQIALTHAETVALAANSYVYDIQRTDAGSEAVLSAGAFRVKQEVLYP